jgi:hypothetical protein
MSVTITAFNSMGGFSVGEIANVVVLPNGDITTSNVSAANGVYTDFLFYSNGTPYNFSEPAGSQYALQLNSGAVPPRFGASDNLKFNPLTNTLDIQGKVEATGNITAAYFLGNVIGNVSGNIVVPGTNTSVLYNNLGNAGASDALKFDHDSNVLTLTGSFEVSSVNASQITSVFLGGQLTTPTQPSITSVGVLNSLSVSGAATVYSLDIDTSANTQSINVSGRTTTYRLTASGIKYPSVDGLPGQAIVTDGSGNLGFISLNTANISNGTSNVNIPAVNGNINFSSAGNANVVVITGTGANINGTANVTGNVTLSGANVSLGAVGNLKITGGSNGYVLQTDGTGNLSWASQASSNIVIDTFTGNGVQTVFTLTNSPTSEDYTLINIDGVSQLHSAYTVANANVTLSSAPAVGAAIEVMTFNLGGGAGGGSGTSGYTYVEATGNTAATVNTKYIVNTNTSNLTITLPSSPSFGDEVGIIDGTGNASVHAITVGRNGGNIQGSASDMTVTTNRSAFTLVYYNASQGWVLTNV